MNKIRVKLQSSLMEEPILIKDSDIFHHYDPRSLDISTNLKKKVLKWGKEFQETFDESYPPDSGFKNKQDERRHQEEGRKLAEELQEELGDGYLVEYKY